MHADDLAREAEADTGASALRGEEGEEDAVGGVGTNAAAVV